MKTFTALAAAAVLMTSISTGSANAQMAGFAAAKAPTTEASQSIVHKTNGRRGGGRRHGGKIAAGIALGILGAAAIAHQSHRYSDSYESSHERRCRRWMYRCEDGNYRACNKFDRRC